MLLGSNVIGYFNGHFLIRAIMFWLLKKLSQFAIPLIPIGVVYNVVNVFSLGFVTFISLFDIGCFVVVLLFFFEGGWWCDRVLCICVGMETSCFFFEV